MSEQRGIPGLGQDEALPPDQQGTLQETTLPVTVNPGLPPRGTLVQYTPSQELQNAVGFTPDTYNAFRDQVATNESNRYEQPPMATGSATTPAVMGRYQMGDAEIAATAKRLGVPTPSREQFLSDPDLQEQFFDNYTLDHHNAMMKYPQYANGDVNTRAALLMGAHLGGPNSSYFRGEGNPQDINGTSVGSYVQRMLKHMSALNPIGSAQAAEGYPPFQQPTYDQAAAKALQAQIQASQSRDRQVQNAGIPNSSSPPPGSVEYYQAKQAEMQQQASNPFQPQGGVWTPEQYDLMNQIKNTAKEAGSSLARGLAQMLGAPVDAINGMLRFAASQPAMGVQQVPEAGMADAITGDNAIGSMLANPAGQRETIQGTNLIAGGALGKVQGRESQITAPQIPAGGSETMLKGVKALGINSQTPEQRGMNSPGLQFTSDIGESVGMGGAGLLGFGRGLATAGVKAAVKAGALDMLTSGFFPGLGNAMGKELAGEGGSAIGQVAGTAIGIKAAAIRSGFNKFVVEPAEGGGASLLKRLTSATAAPALLDAATDDLAGALARVQTLRELGPVGSNLQPAKLNVPGTGEVTAGMTGDQNLVPGFITPTYALSADPGLQTAAAHMIKQDPEAFRTTRALVDNNAQAVQGQIGLTGQEPVDVKQALTQYAADRSTLTQKAIADAQTRAEQATEAATGGAPAGSLVEKANRSQASMAELERVDQDRRSMANADFDLAHQTGVMQTNVGMPENAYSAATQLLSEYRKLHLDSSIPNDALTLLFKGGANPEALFDRNGVRIPGAAFPAREFGPQTTMEQQQTLMSQIGNMLTNEGSKIRMGTGAGDPQKVRFLGKLQDAVRQDFELGLNASGNPAVVRNALNNWDEYTNTFRKGILGRALGYDASGAPRIAPEVAMDQILKNGTQGVANTKQLLNAMQGQLNPATGQPMQPMQVLRDKLVDFLQQDFANASSQGPVAMEKWAQNHEAILTGSHATPGTPFYQLNNDVNHAIVENKNWASMKPRAEAADDAVSLFLKGNPGGELNKALSGPDRGLAMNQLLEATNADPHGLATQGLGKMLMDRMFSAGARPAVSGAGWDLNPRASAAYFKENLDAFKAFDAYSPGFSDRAAQISNSIERMAQIASNPGGPLPENFDRAQAFATAGGLGRIVSRMVGASAGEYFGAHMLGGHIGGKLQYAAIGAEQGAAMWDAAFGKLTRAQAGATLREAMFDPDAFATLAKKWVSIDDAYRAVGAMQTLMQHLPRGYQVSPAVGVIAPAQPPGPMTGPNPQALGGLPPNSLGGKPGLPLPAGGPTLLPGGRAPGMQ